MNNPKERKSRTAVKHEMENLQKLGEKLAAFSLDQIKSMDIPDELKKAVIDVKSIGKFGAKRRQFQYIGSLMRNINPEIVVNAVNKISMGRDIASAKFNELERWRDKLLIGNPETVDDSERVIDEFIKIYPHTDRQRLRSLIRNARKKNMHGNNKNLKSARALFRYIREISEV